jgi:hypothetical protein
MGSYTPHKDRTQQHMAVFATATAGGSRGATHTTTLDTNHTSIQRCAHQQCAHCMRLVALLLLLQHMRSLAAPPRPHPLLRTASNMTDATHTTCTAGLQPAGRNGPVWHLAHIQQHRQPTQHTGHTALAYSKRARDSCSQLQQQLHRNVHFGASTSQSRPHTHTTRPRPHPSPRAPQAAQAAELQLRPCAPAAASNCRCCCPAALLCSWPSCSCAHAAA